MSLIDVARQQAGTDYCLPFQLDQNAFRGRLVRLGPVMDSILNRHHDYPRPVARLLAETMLLCTALAGALKYDGIFSLQAKGDGAIKDLVADVTGDGAIRAYASFDAERVEREDPGTEAVALLLGHGYIAFTVDPSDPNAQRYQGIAELKGRTLADCVTHYFQQSEQIPTGFSVACDQVDGPDGQKHWHGRAVMLQRMPRAGDDVAGGTGRSDAISTDNSNDNVDADFEARADDLRRKMMLLGTTKEQELLDQELTGEALLHRLFHDDYLQLESAYGLRDECRCSRARVERVLRTLPQDERADMMKDGIATVTCEFCNRHYDFDATELENLDKVFHMDIAQAKLEAEGLTESPVASLEDITNEEPR